MSSMRSASSSTSTSRSSKTTLPRSRWSIRRPGVATTTSTPRAQRASPAARAARRRRPTSRPSGVCCAYFWKLSSTCRQSSRVGVSTSARSAARSVEQPVDDRQRERGGLAGAGLREADEVAAVEDQRNRLALDRRGLRVAGVASPPAARHGRQPELVECRTRRHRRRRQPRPLCSCSLRDLDGLHVAPEANGVASARHVLSPSISPSGTRVRVPSPRGRQDRATNILRFRRSDLINSRSNAQCASVLARPHARARVWPAPSRRAFASRRPSTPCPTASR